MLVLVTNMNMSSKPNGLLAHTLERGIQEGFGKVAVCPLVVWPWVGGRALSGGQKHLMKETVGHQILYSEANVIVGPRCPESHAA